MLVWVFGVGAALAQQPLSPRTPSPSETGVAHARSLIAARKIDQGLALLGQIERKAPQTPGIEAALGHAYYAKHEYTQAVTNLELALKQNPEDKESTQLLGLADYMAGMRCVRAFLMALRVSEAP